MDLCLSDSVLDFRDRFEDWVAEHLPTEWRDVPVGAGGEGSYVQMRRAWGRRLHEGGWLAPQWPAEYGGLGLGVQEQIAEFEVLVASGAPEPMNSNGIGIFAPALIHFGTEDQKRRWLPPILAHDEVWCQGFSEPQAGSDLASLRTRADPDGRGWRLNGQKVWTSYAQYADRCYLLARVPDRGITMFVLDMDQPGVTVRPLRNLTGSEEFCEVFLDDAVVAPDSVVGEVGAGWQVTTFALGCERSTFLAQRALPMSREFQNLLRLIGAAQPEALANEMFVDAFLRTRVLDSFMRRVQATAAGGDELGTLAPMGKLVWSEAHQAQLALLVEAVGPRFITGTDGFGPWQRSFLYARAETIYGGTSEIQRNLIAKSLGLPSDRPQRS